MSFRGIDHCLRCGRPLRASAETFIGDCCVKKTSPARLEAMRAYAAQVADPFHIPAPRPISTQGRLNNLNARNAVRPEALQLCRHENAVGRCGACRREADPARAAERILGEIRAQPYTARRGERVAVQAARRARGIPAPAQRPARRPPRRRATTTKPSAPEPAVVQLELI
jgi:hypothetical protein